MTLSVHVMVPYTVCTGNDTVCTCNGILYRCNGTVYAYSGNAHNPDTKQQPCKFSR